MRSICSLFALTVFLIATGMPAQGAGIVAREGAAKSALTGALSTRGGRRVLTLWGSPRQRGYAHGYLLAKEIHALIAKDFAGFLATRRMAPEDYERKIVRGLVNFFRWSPEEVEELRGMLAGFQDRLEPAERRIEFLDRELSLKDLQAINTAGDWLNLGCSSIALRGRHTADGEPVVVRNFDFFGFRSLLDDQLVVRSIPEGAARKAWLGVTHPGSIGVITALSSARVFVSIHDVPRRASPAHFIRPNVPRLSALRRLAEELDADGAVAAAHARVDAWPTLFGNNFMVATPGEGAFAGVLEYDSDRSLDKGATLRSGDRVGSEPAGAWLACTNHHRARRVGAESKLDWCRRYRDLQAFFAKRADEERAMPLGVPALFELASLVSMSAKAEIQKRIQLGTLHQAVARLGAGELHLKLGRIGHAVASQECLVFTLEELAEARKQFARSGD